METKKLNGYKIDFYSEEEWARPYMIDINFMCTFGHKVYDDYYHNKNKYADLVSNITEELAEKIVYPDAINDGDWYYKNYKTEEYHYDGSAKESFQTLSDLPFCVITKITE